MDLPKPKFNELIGKIAYDLNRRKEVAQDIENDLASDSIDREEARYEASLRFLELAKMVLLDLKNLQQSIDNRGSTMQNQPEMLHLAREWFKKAKDYYKCKSDFYFFLKKTHKEKSQHLKEELSDLEKQFEQFRSDNIQEGDFQDEMYG